MDPDDIAYRKSVRNMIVVLAAIVITVFAALFIPPYVYPYHDVFQPAVSMDSPYGFTLHLKINSTSVAPGGTVLIAGWLNSTSGSLENITAANSWAPPQSSLWTKVCTSGWPIGVGVMRGHYTQDNFTLGSLIPIVLPAVDCPVPIGSPSYFILEAHSSRALVSLSGTPTVWEIQTSFTFRQNLSGYQLQPGVYTAVVADEWGDVLLTNFQVP